jgi:trans-2,3-dihydro-3-hydroxyanthranilate isomerase
MRRRFATLDVFTDRRFAGNPLAVVLDAEALDATAMQAIAREFNHPETVFVFAPADPAHRARVRIFTPARELPFAGHPTVGTAVLLGSRDGGGRDLVLEEGIGAVRCTLESTSGGGGSARFVIPQLPTEAGAPADDAAIAAALSLAPSDIGEGRPARWSAGLPFTFVPIASLSAMARCRLDLAKFDAAFGAGGAAYAFCNETAESGHHFHARMFAPGMGVPEDPATGSAAAAFAGVLARRLRDGTHVLVIEQGYEMGRPSLIRLTAEVAAGRLVSASIGGNAVIVTEGRSRRERSDRHRNFLPPRRTTNDLHESAWARRVPRLCPRCAVRARHDRACNHCRSGGGAGAELGRQALQSIGMDEGALHRGRHCHRGGQDHLSRRGRRRGGERSRGRERSDPASRQSL